MNSEKKKHWYHSGPAKAAGTVGCVIFAIALALSLFGMAVLLSGDYDSTSVDRMRSDVWNQAGREYALMVMEEAQKGGEEKTLSRTLDTYGQSALRFGVMRFPVMITKETNWRNVDPAPDSIGMEDVDSYFYLSEDFDPQTAHSYLICPEGSGITHTLTSPLAVLFRGGYVSYVPSEYEDYYWWASDDGRTEGEDGSEEETSVDADAVEIRVTAESDVAVILEESAAADTEETEEAAESDDSTQVEAQGERADAEREYAEEKTWYAVVWYVDEAAAASVSDAADSGQSQTAQQMDAMFAGMSELAGLMQFYGKWSVLLLTVSFAGFLFFLSLALTAAGHRDALCEVYTRWIDRVWLEIVLLLAAGAVAMILAAGWWLCSEFLFTQSAYVPDIPFLLQLLLLLAVMAVLVLLGTAMTVAVRMKTKTFWRSTAIGWLAGLIGRFFGWIKTGLCRMGRAVTERTDVSVRVILLFLGLTLLECFVTAACDGDQGVMIFWILCAKLVSFPLILSGLLQLEKIREGAARIAAGQTEVEIPTDRMYPALRRMAKDINQAGEGVRRSVELQTRSERMKTELITNVSHDIRTPLTSIVNYVDLLSKEPVASEAANGYLEVLTRQSDKLKKLIDDLIEASKAATGNLEMNIVPCDVPIVLNQALGEFEDRLTQRGISVNQTAEHVPKVQADPRYLWRVFDNLLGNACKYAMPQTRLYIDIREASGGVMVTFKNVSSTPLVQSGEELMERFVQGDSSRSEDGSGLGLSIASNLMRLMNGAAKVDCDGDLFKVTLWFTKAPEQAETADRGE